MERGSLGALLNVATSSYIRGMISVGIRELKNNLSRYLKKVKAGQRIAITDRGRVVAELRKPQSASASSLKSRLDELIVAGLARGPIESGDPLENLPSFRLPPGTAAGLIDADRGER
ncbi:MAG: type II toxin-antitoxin system Phd/YefM family antitoxin [Gemmatimonadaceae bacterium]